MDTVIRLRGHHLLCMLTWAGRGYSEEFTALFDKVVPAIRNGAIIEIVKGPDDLCQTLDPQTTPDYHCLGENELWRDDNAIASINERLGLSLAIGGRFTVDEAMLGTLQAEYKSGAIRPACERCQWRDFCTEIADDDFKVTRFEA